MKEIFVLAGCLGLMLLVLWVIVTCLEKRFERRKGRAEVIKKREEGEGKDCVLTVVIAGIVAYEESLKKSFVRRRISASKKKEEKVSLWKIKGRIG